MILRIFTTLFCFFAALNQAFAELSIQESMFTKESIERLNPFWGSQLPEDHPQMKALRQAQKEMLKALPQTQLLLLIRDMLPQILETYAIQQPDASQRQQTKEYLELIKKSFPQEDLRKSELKGTQVSFAYSFDGRFQVEGIDPDRLAYNNGQEIVFNISALNKKPDMSLAELTLLWLHEILHFDKKTPLEVHDKWAAEVAQFVKTYSAEKRLSGARRIISLLLPSTKSPEKEFDFALEPDGYLRETSGGEYLIYSLKKRIIILEQTPETTQYYEKAYSGFLNLIDESIAKPHFIRSPGMIIKWPRIQFKNLRWNSQGVLQVSYSSQDIPYMFDHRYKFVRLESIHPVQPVLWSNDFRLDIDPEKDQVDMHRSFSSLLKDGFFEINRIVDEKGRRYISLRIKMDSIYADTKEALSIQVIGKDVKSQQLLSLPVQKIKALSASEVLVHLEIPLRNIELHQVLVPLVNHNGTYAELSIKPLRPETILGPIVEASVPALVSSFKIQEKKLDTDKVTAQLSIKTNRKIKAVTLEMTHNLQARSISLNNLPVPPERPHDEVYIVNSRKYYLDGKKLVQDGTSLRFEIPEHNIEQITAGPRTTRRFSRFYQQTYQESYKTIVDQQQRRIARAWVHYEDGSLEALKSQVLPDWFSLVSEQSEVRLKNEIAQYYQNYFTPDPPEAPVKISTTQIRCGAIFK